MIPLLLPAAAAQQEPVDINREETVRVRLVLVDVLVTDRGGSTVPGLAREDFTLLVQNRPVKIDTLDARCDAGGLADPEPRSALDEPLAPVPDSPARMILLFDNYHMDMGDRQDALRHAREIVRSGSGEGDELMVAVLSDGLRILQTFTSDRQRLQGSLDRMQQDVTLWARLFDPPYRPLTEKGFFRDLAQLMNVLMNYEGSKAVVMFSSFRGRSDDNDLWYLDLAHRAAESRTALYPVYARGLEPPKRGGRSEPTGGSRALARMANESGGRFTRLTNDLSLGYLRARRDLTCRYTLGFYLKGTGRNGVDDSRNIVVRVRGKGRVVRHPERLRGWDGSGLRRAAASAAEVDPGPFLDAAVQAGTKIQGPAGGRQRRVSIHAEAPRTAAAAALVVLVTRNRKTVRRYERAVPAGRPVQWSRSLRLAPGDYEVVVVLDDPGRSGPVTAARAFRVPGIDPPG